MAHFAEVDENNVVKRVIVIDNNELDGAEFPESEAIGQAHIASMDIHGTWLQTSYNNNFRVRYAGIGWSYDPDRDAFIGPKPFESWVLNEDTLEWEAPVPRPSEEDPWDWDEENVQWVEGMAEPAS